MAPVISTETVGRKESCGKKGNSTSANHAITLVLSSLPLSTKKIICVSESCADSEINFVGLQFLQQTICDTKIGKMATAMPIIKEDKKLPESGIKCRQCRSGFLIEVVDSEKSESFTSTTDLYLINEEDLPNWVSEKVEEVRSHNDKCVGKE